MTHSGDSDSTGAICGNILGALHGETALPPARGITDFIQEPTEHFYGIDMAVRDPFGNAIRFLQPAKGRP